jgi:hypothetical protein
MDDWVTITVKVAKEETNEAEWAAARPSAWQVAAEIRERLEGVDLDTGWKIVKVSS